MLLAEIIKTCSHEKVAQAAVASIGGDFLCRVERVAQERGLRSGVFIASSVRRFAREAGDHEWAALALSVEGKDMPILAGLRHILEVTLARQATALELGSSHPRAATGRVVSAAACNFSCGA